jgi:arylsulfatase A-like enzyme
VVRDTPVAVSIRSAYTVTQGRAYGKGRPARRMTGMAPSTKRQNWTLAGVIGAIVILTAIAGRLQGGKSPGPSPETPGPSPEPPSTGEPVSPSPAAEEPASPPPAPVNNLVFVSWDTVRRDHLPTYGYQRETAPKLDRFAREGIIFDNAATADCTTNPSHTSMFTGTYPHLHGNFKNKHVLAVGQKTLAAILREHGVRTVAFISGSTMRAEVTGLERGFDIYEDEFAGYRRKGDETTRLAVRWLRNRKDGKKRFFLFLHLFDAHGPYDPPPSYRALFQSPEPGPYLRRIQGYQYRPFKERNGRVPRNLNDYVDRYDASIRFEDDLTADLLKEVDLSDTMVVVLSDHGETLGDRYWTLDHGGQPYDEQVRIPLVVRVPGYEGRRIRATVETVDLLPTILELMGVQVPGDMVVKGRSLLDLMAGRTDEHRDHAFTTARSISARHGHKRYRLRKKTRTLSIREPRWKLIRLPGARRDYLELYRIDRDPGEKKNVAGYHPEVVRRLNGKLVRWYGKGPRIGVPVSVDPRIQRQLESLGYADDE